jgi:hypothetical protein
MEVSGQLHAPAVYPRGLDRRLGGPLGRSGPDGEKKRVPKHNTEVGHDLVESFIIIPEYFTRRYVTRVMDTAARNE